MPRHNALKDRHLPESKGWALYWRMSELLLSPKEEWCRMKWNLYANVQRSEIRASSWEEGLSLLPEGEWAVAESQRGMTQDKVKFVYQIATPWKTEIFLQGRLELITGGRVSFCWVPKKDENEKNNYKADERKRKGKCKDLVWCNLAYKNVLSFAGKDL